MKLLTNEKMSNHLSCLKKMATKADTLIIVSPFVTDDISKLIEDMVTVKNITLYTSLQKYVLFEKVKSALVWILLILNTMINSLDFTNSKDCFYSYGLY